MNRGHTECRNKLDEPAGLRHARLHSDPQDTLEDIADVMISACCTSLL